MFAVATASSWDNRKVAAVLTYVRAVLNDSTSTNCVPGGVEIDVQYKPDCDNVARPSTATSMITPAELQAPGGRSPGGLARPRKPPPRRQCARGFFRVRPPSRPPTDNAPTTSFTEKPMTPGSPPC